MKPKLIHLTIFLIILYFLPLETMMGQCTNCDGSTSSVQNVSSAIGNRTKASGFAAFASGSNVIASGNYSSSLGLQNHSSADQSLTMGSNLIAAAEGSMVIGKGFDMRSRMSNTKANSLMVGFRSMYPTLFIGTSPSVIGTGRVGIGNVTEPQAKLHIRADDREPASLFLEQNEFSSADIFIGNMAHGIQSSSDYGLIFHSEKNYIFNEGKLGIGTLSPQFDLEVHGKTYTKHFTLFDSELYQENIDGWILRSDYRGKAVWTDPALLDDHDWTLKENNVYRLEGNVGIGTASPVAQLDIADIYPAGGMNIKIGDDAYLSDIDRGHTLGIFSQTQNEIGAIKLGGLGPTLFGMDKKLGIGTNQPATTVELSNAIAGGKSVGLCISNPETFSWFVGMDGNQKYINDLLIGNFDNLGAGLSSFIVVKQDGNVGLGTNDTYGYKLAINGALLTEEVTVKVKQSWPDFVFKKDYELLPLDKLEQYIEKNGHLPQIPNAEKILAEGLKVGEMERLLLQKVEELTLYLIEQQAVINKMEKRIGKIEQ
ncbi:MAG: hypothetical protein RQ761_01510 [Bacteroidales bacterium]|nr:hypothetical protein [Bacteroidales bacterium]